MGEGRSRKVNGLHAKDVWPALTPHKGPQTLLPGASSCLIKPFVMKSGDVHADPNAAAQCRRRRPLPLPQAGGLYTGTGGDQQ